MRRLRFEYCECGCKCHEGGLGSYTFSLFNDLGGNYYLSRGGGLRTRYGSFNEAVDAASREFNAAMEKVYEPEEETDAPAVPTTPAPASGSVYDILQGVK